MNFRQRSKFLFEDGDRAEGGVGVPVAVDPLPYQVFVFPDVTSIVRFISVSVVTVWTPGKKLRSKVLINTIFNEHICFIIHKMNTSGRYMKTGFSFIWTVFMWPLVAVDIF